jgi:hypothetical protein
MAAVNDTDYTVRTVEAWQERLRNLRRTAFPGWTDDSEENVGNLENDAIALGLHKVGYYLNSQAREKFLVSCTQRKSAVAITRPFFRPATARAAQATERFTLTSVPAHDVPFPPTRCLGQRGRRGAAGLPAGLGTPARAYRRRRSRRPGWGRTP